MKLLPKTIFSISLAAFTSVSVFAADQALLDELATVNYHKEGGALKHQIIAAMEADDFANGWEAGLVEVVVDRDAKIDGRQLAAELLKRCVTEASVEKLGSLLSETVMTTFARDLLEGIEGDSADEVLVDALSTSQSSQKIAIMAALAKRRTSAAIPELKPIALSASDPEMVVTALNSIGLIGGKDALKFFKNNLELLEGHPVIAGDFAEAALLCANASYETGSKSSVSEIANAVIAADVPQVQQINAAIVLQKLDPKKSKMWVKWMSSDEAVDLLKARAAFPYLELDDKALAKVVKASSSWNDRSKNFLLLGLAENNRPEAITLARKWLNVEGDKALVMTCLDVMAEVGEKTDAEVLYPIATGDSELAEEAIKSIGYMPDSAITDWLVTTFETAEAEEQKAILELMVARNLRQELVGMFASIDSYPDSTQKQIVRSIGRIGDSDSAIAMLDKRAEVSKPIQSEIGRAVIAIGDRTISPVLADRLVDEWAKASGSEKSRFLRMIAVNPHQNAKNLFNGLLKTETPDAAALKILTTTKDDQFSGAIITFLKREDISEADCKAAWKSLFRITKDLMSRGAWMSNSRWKSCVQFVPSDVEVEQMLDYAITNPNERFISLLKDMEGIENAELEAKRKEALGISMQLFGL